MKINMAHLRLKAAAGGYIDVAVFDARSSSGSQADNEQLLAQLTAKAGTLGLKIDQSALAFSQNRKPVFYGSRHLVDYLSKGWIPQWTHSLTV